MDTPAASIPVAYRCPITDRDLSRLLTGRAHVHVTVRRRPPHLTFVLVPRGRRHFPTSWASTNARVYFEPAALEHLLREDQPGDPRAKRVDLSPGGRGPSPTRRSPRPRP